MRLSNSRKKFTGYPTIQLLIIQWRDWRDGQQWLECLPVMNIQKYSVYYTVTDAQCCHAQAISFSISLSNRLKVTQVEAKHVGQFALIVLYGKQSYCYFPWFFRKMETEQSI